MAEGTGAPKPGDEKPLHVRVAEALGVMPRRKWAIMNREETGFYIAFDRKDEADADLADHLARYPQGMYARAGARVVEQLNYPWFDEDWSATGPLIGRYKIRLSYSSQGRAFADHPSVDSEDQREGERDILPAVCRLILALHAAGKLPEAR